MNQLIAIAMGGSLGSIVRFLVSSGLHHWLGGRFPYGTLAVNVIGSFLIGLLTETLILQRAAIALEYRVAIIIGFIGAFTTFSTFALETFYLLEQGQLLKACLNVFGSVFASLLAVWVGLLCGRALFYFSNGVIYWSGGSIPYALMVVNVIGAFMIGFIVAILLQKVVLAMEYRAALMVILVGIYLTLTGLYLLLFLIEHGYSFDTQINYMLGIFVSNGLMCLLSIWLGLLLARQF